MKHLESDIQTACVRWFDMQYPKFKLLLHHSPNGGFRNKIEAARFKAQGTRAGFPDLVLLVPCGGYHGLFIEMKSPKGVMSDSQKTYRDEVINQGYAYDVCRSLDEFISVVNLYLKGS